MIFRNWVLQNFPFLEDDFDALTDYELFCKMVEYMKKSLEKVEGFQATINEFTIKLNEFQHYFDNLDVTEEVNAKLDEMADDGTLEALIAQYLQITSTYTFNSVAEMKESEELINGSFVRTSGFYSYNDGGGAFYKVRNVTVDDVIDEIFIFELASNEVVAEYIPQNDTYNIRQLGCKGDNETDNTERLQAIITKAQNTGCDVLIPMGNYIISDTIYITNNINIYGVGKHRLWKGVSKYPRIIGYIADKPLFHISDQTSTLYNWDTSASHLVENVHIKNLIISGSDTGTFSITGIYANVYLSSFENLIINGFINDFAIAGSYETLIENCQFVQSYQCVVSFNNNRTTIFNNCWFNSGYHTSGSVVSDTDYTTLYTKNHLFNYCCMYSNQSYHYLNNVAFENCCYGLISRDSKIIGDIINFETLSDYCVHCSLNVRPNDSYTDIDNAHFYIPSTSDYSNAKMFYTSYHSYLDLKTCDALPISNLADGDMVNNSVARIYSYITGEKIIPLTLSSNVEGASVKNKSHYTKRGFKIDYEFSGQTAWSSGYVTQITTLPASTEFTSGNQHYFTCPSTDNATIKNLRINGAGQITNASGSWTGGADNLPLIVRINYEYEIK